MGDLVERFRYRFQLWRQAQREDWAGPPDTHGPDLRDYIPPDSPAAMTTRSQSVPKILTRAVVVYIAGVFILLQAAKLITGWAPSISSDVSVLIVILLCLWTTFVIFGVTVHLKVKRLYRSGGKADDLTNR